MEDKQRRTLAVLVDNEAGVLSQVTRLFSRKGYNIESLAVGATDNPAVSRITIEVDADDDEINLLCNQLNKLFQVHSVKLLSPQYSIKRELVLIKVKAENPDARNEIMQIASIFRASIIDVSVESLTVAVIGSGDKLFAFEDLLAQHGIMELVRTGIVALERGSFTIDEATKVKNEYDYAKALLW
ncbi:MAG: acetolactate synthase small subunit [Firmicutes bacterium]|nr:acetolactate synthase small subunit [Bacillota bacterium]MBR6025302.1 acetolactate synthase small subunit [Bacillota bacterium]